MKIKLVIAFLFMAILATNFALLGQTRIRTLEEVKPYPNQPLQVVGKRLGEKNLNEAGFEAESNWLRDLSIEVRNVSGKNITYAYSLLLIQKQGTMEASYALPLLYENGNPPIAPGDVATLKVLDGQYMGAMKYLAQYQVKDVENVILTIQRVYFDDNTRWVIGKESRQDPSDKKKWIPISQRKSLRKVPMNVFF